MEQQMNMVVVVSHVSVIQVLMSYFRRTPIENCTSNEVPMNTVIKFTPVSGGGWTESQHKLCPSPNIGLYNIEETDSEQSSQDQIISPIWGDESLTRKNSMSYEK